MDLMASATAQTDSCVRVLVVDDNRDAANSLTRLLRVRGYEVRTAYDGPTALSEAMDFQPGKHLT